jgi:hypothetical protein
MDDMICLIDQDSASVRQRKHACKDYRYVEILPMYFKQHKKTRI